jgi:3D-(3,5/4)-trihydroxycyclohexane-1,2-dione acylhydrolase (decyclizing)
MTTVRLTVGQALVKFLASQSVERDGRLRQFFGGCFGIFGHGNVAGIGEALYQHQDEFRYYQARNEQSMVHTAVGYARMHNRLATLACTSSIGPGATNMLTGAALATVNRLPVLLLPGDAHAVRAADPVLQQLESPSQGDMTVNDCFRPVSRYWDRISRPEQLISATMNAMRVLTDPAETGAVTLCLPQDVQTEAYDFPERFLASRTWLIPRTQPAQATVERAVRLIRTSKRPLIVAGGGVIYSEAVDALRGLSQRTGIPVAETQAGKGAMLHGMPGAAGAIGVTGSRASNRLAAGADLVIGVGTRWTDFTTASSSLFQDPAVQLININVAAMDSLKYSALAVMGDARCTLESLIPLLDGFRVPAEYQLEVEHLIDSWNKEVDELTTSAQPGKLTQAEIIGALNKFASRDSILVCAAGSMPGDLHKLWRTENTKQYQVEYGYSCMGYEIAGALGAKLADPEREVYALVGDGSYLMLNEAITTSVQEGLKIVVVIVNNHGHASIGALSRSVGCDGFGTKFRIRSGGSLGTDRDLDGDKPLLPVNLAMNAESLGAIAMHANDLDSFRDALDKAARTDRTTAICVEVDRYAAVPAYDSWWDAPVAEVSELEAVRRARAVYAEGKRGQRKML